MQTIQKDFRVTMMWQFLPQTDLALSTILLAGGTPLNLKCLMKKKKREKSRLQGSSFFSGVISDASGKLHPCSVSSAERHLIIFGKRRRAKNSLCDAQKYPGKHQKDQTSVFHREQDCSCSILQRRHKGMERTLTTSFYRHQEIHYQF